ncbi:MAG TPA: competence/damage-inducible protein A [Bacteroidia bacterium]|nr:competence/damage-inducible protein A [Bacteroidia bacterium]HRG51787.1 competence/damage-inducible protein A [Bacteroidia bacterium]
MTTQVKQVQVEIITIGDEILIGQIVDTNSAFMAQLLNLNGVSVKQISSVSDDREHIIKALDEAKERADIILITGGLGPTKDDITKKTLCEYFNTTMRFDETAYQDVVAIFASYNKEVTPINRKQAEVPAICEVLRNHHGTAPGMWFDVNNKVFVSMPGVPFEMKALMTNEVVPKLKSRFKFPEIYHKTVLTQGIGESSLSELISDWEDQLASVNIKLAYLPSPGLVRLRLSTFGSDSKQLKEEVEKQINSLQTIAGKYIYGYETYGEEKKTMEQLVAELLLSSKKTVSTAESCTGGYISHLLTSIPGSSAYYIGSIVSYAYEIKENELEISKEVLMKNGAVSQIVVEQMAQTIRKKYKTDYAISTSGIAGPTGGTDEKPVGTVWIAVATPERVISAKFLFGNNRERTIQKAAHAALNMLKGELETIKS